LTTGFIGSQSQLSYSVLNLQWIHFTTHYCSCNSSGIPCHHLLTLFNRTVALTLKYTRNSRNCNSLLSCQLTNSADSAISYIAGERTQKKTLPRNIGCCCLGTDLVENAAFQLLHSRLGSDHIENMSRGVCLAMVVNKRFHCLLDLQRARHNIIFNKDTHPPVTFCLQKLLTSIHF
jgi:hypothetical protein